MGADFSWTVACHRTAACHRCGKNIRRANWYDWLDGELRKRGHESVLSLNRSHTDVHARAHLYRWCDALGLHELARYVVYRHHLQRRIVVVVIAVLLFLACSVVVLLGTPKHHGSSLKRPCGPTQPHSYIQIRT